ncbi:porin family protein [Spirosoma aerophilum]
MHLIRCLFLALAWIPATLAFGQKALSVSATVVPTVSRTLYRARYFYPNSDGQIVEPVFLNGRRWSAGYSAGVSLNYTYAPGWSVSSGVWFNELTTQQARQAMAGEGTVTLRKRVVRIPILLNYASSTHRLSPYFSFGLLTDIPVPSRVVVDRTGESTQYLRLELNRRPIFNLLVGAGIQYKLTSQFNLVAQPAWTYKMGQLGGASTNDSSFELSLQTQLAYSF